MTKEETRKILRSLYCITCTEFNSCDQCDRELNIEKALSELNNKDEAIKRRTNATE